MPAGFDPRIVGPGVLSFLQACQKVQTFHLGGGAALAGVHLRHRLSADADLFVHDREGHRDLGDLLFLDRAGYPPEHDLPLDVAELMRFRNELRERFRQAALPRG